MAAVLACGGREGPVAEDAFLSHMSAAALWGLLAPRGGPVDVSILGEKGRTRRPGLRIHRPRTLELEMTTRRNGIPVTDPRRTIGDLRRAKSGLGGATPKELRRAMRQAAVLGLGHVDKTPVTRTRSDLEWRFLGLCRKAALPIPEVNVKIDRLEVDFLWRARRLVVETDGYRYHRGRIAHEDDHARDLRLAELGFRVLRFDESQLNNEAARVTALLRRELAAD